MDPWAIMNTQEIWAQPSPPPTLTVVTSVMMTMASHCIDSCVTAGSNPKPSPSPSLLPSSPSPPSTYGAYTHYLATQRQPNATITTTETGQNEGKGDMKRLLGVSDETEQMGRRKQGEWLENHRLDPRKSPPQTTSTITSKSMCSAPSGNNHSAWQSVTAQELESSHRTCNEYQAAWNRTYGPSGLDSSPPELIKWLTRANLGEFRKWHRKQAAARAQHPPSDSEKTQDVKDNVIHIEKERKSTSRVINHSLSELTPQTHHLPLSPARLMCFDVPRHVEHHPGPLQSPSDTTQATGQGCKQPPSPMLPPIPSPSHIMQSNVNLHVGNISEPSPLPPDANRVTKQGYKQPSPSPSPRLSPHPSPLNWTAVLVLSSG